MRRKKSNASKNQTEKKLVSNEKVLKLISQLNEIEEKTITAETYLKDIRTETSKFEDFIQKERERILIANALKHKEEFSSEEKRIIFGEEEE